MRSEKVDPDKVKIETKLSKIVDHKFKQLLAEEGVVIDLGKIYLDGISRAFGKAPTKVFSLN